MEHVCTDDRNEQCSPEHCTTIGCPAKLGPYRAIEMPALLLFTSCPQCAAGVYECDQAYCRARGTDHTDGEGHCCYNEYKKTYGGHFRAKLEGYLNFTYGTSPQRLCSPQRRVRMGFLWLRQCTAPGIHVHQKCERCCWAGPSVEPCKVCKGFGSIERFERKSMGDTGIWIACPLCSIPGRVRKPFEALKEQSA